MNAKKLRFRKKAQFKNMVYFAICACLLLITSGMAYIKSSVSISGVSSIGNISWNIHFDNFVPGTGSIESSGATVLDPSDKTRLNFSLTFDDPKDFYEFEVDVINEGTLNAVVSNVNFVGLSSELEPYMTYSFGYTDGSNIQIGDVLNKDDVKRIKFNIKFKEDVNLADLFKDEAITFDLSFDIDYKQLNS